MSKFNVGDRVKWVRDSTKLNLYTEYIGKEYTIDEIYEYLYHLKEADLWVSGMAIEKNELGKEKDWEVSDPAQDRFTLTIERFGTDGKKYMCGVADICEAEFYAMWDCYVA